MRKIIFYNSFLIFLFFGTIVYSEEQIKRVIEDQINAFRLEDYDRAYSHASKTIKSIFPTSLVFVTMVKTSYPMIWSPKEYKFLGTDNKGDIFVQRVLFFDQKDRMYIFDYMMEFSNKKWFINGVYPVEGSSGT